MVDESNSELRRRIRQYKKALKQARGVTDESGVRQRGELLFRIASDLMQLDRLEEAIQYYEDADVVLWGSKLNVPAIHGRTQRGIALMRLGRYEEALRVFNGLVDKVGLRASSVEFPDIMATAINMRLLLLELLGYSDQAGPAADEVIEAVDPRTTALHRKVVVQAYRVRGEMARARGDLEVALAGFNDALRLCDGGVDTDLVPLQARTMAARGGVLAELGRTQDALAACNEVIERFGSMPTDPAGEAVLAARKLKGALELDPDYVSASHAADGPGQQGPPLPKALDDVVEGLNEVSQLGVPLNEESEKGVTCERDADPSRPDAEASQ